MNRKDLKERIKQSAMEEIPDIFDRMNINQISIKPEQKVSAYSRFHFKWAISAFILVLMAIFTFQLFIQTPSSNPFESDIELIAFQAVSAQSFIEYSDDDLEQLSFSLSNEALILNVNDASDVEDYLADMSKMIEIGELLINEESQIQYQALDSDNENYQYKVRFSAVNLQGDNVEYDIYFNELDGEVEGLLVQSEKAYLFTKDTQGLKLYVYDNEYIYVQYEKSQSIHQFNFKYMKEANEVFSTRIDLVLENATYQANFEYNNQMGKVITMQMIRNSDETMDVDYDIKDNAKSYKGKFNVSVEDDEISGKTIYRFKFGDDSETQTNKPGNQKPNGPQGGPRN